MVVSYVVQASGILSSRSTWVCRRQELGLSETEIPRRVKAQETVRDVPRRRCKSEIWHFCNCWRQLTKSVSNLWETFDVLEMSGRLHRGCFLPHLCLVWMWNFHISLKISKRVVEDSNQLYGLVSETIQGMWNRIFSTGVHFSLDFQWTWMLLQRRSWCRMQYEKAFSKLIAWETLNWE